MVVFYIFYWFSAEMRSYEGLQKNNNAKRLLRAFKQTKNEVFSNLYLLHKG